MGPAGRVLLRFLAHCIGGEEEAVRRKADSQDERWLRQELEWLGASDTKRRNGGLVILEVKNESSNRRAIGQALEYLSQYDELDFDELAEEFEDSEGGDLRGAFQARFGREIDKATTRRRVYLVAPAHDAYSAVCTQYLSRHLREGIEFHIVTATRDGGGFRIQDFACSVLKRLRELEKGFALNPRGRRLFYVIEPGAIPIVWGIGRWRNGALTFAMTPSRKMLRTFRSHLIPIASPAPARVDLKATGSVWRHAWKPGREATLVGEVTPGGAARHGATYVAFAEFRHGAFGTFRRRPAEEFHREWTRTERKPQPWRGIVALARAK